MSYKSNRKIYYCLLKVSFVREGKIDSMTDVTLYNITFTHTHAYDYMMLQDMKEYITIIIGEFKFELVKI